MDWSIFFVIAIGGGFLVVGTYLIASHIVWARRKDNWLEKMEVLDRDNYIEGALVKSSALSLLFSRAKSLGIGFKLHPDSFRYGEKKGFVWDADRVEQQIRVCVDPKTLRVLPVDLWDQRLVMGHEIGHLVSPSTDFDPPCYESKDFRMDCILEDGYVSCLFREVGANIEAVKLVREVFTANGDPPDVSDIIEEKNRKAMARLRKRCSTCWKELEEGRCPKKPELSAFFQER